MTVLIKIANFNHVQFIMRHVTTEWQSMFNGPFLTINIHSRFFGIHSGFFKICWDTLDHFFLFFLVLFSLEIVQNASWVKHFGDETGCNEALIEERIEVSGTTRKWDEAPNQCLNTTSAPTSSYLNIYWEKYETVDWFEEVTVFSKTFGPDALCMLRGDSLTRALVKFKRRISRSINQLYDI